MVLSSRERLIKILADHKHTYVSGQWLSVQLGKSRTAVWKHIKCLEADGYVFEAVQNKGYRLVNMPDKVSENTLFWGLNTRVFGQTIEYFDVLDSTQNRAHQRAQEDKPEGYLIVANKQLNGRGRLKRSFYSNNSDGAWFSFIVRPKIMPQEAQKLTLLTAVALRRTIKDQTALDIKIKWPNDLLINGKKVAGILTEMQAEQDGIHYVIIGVGVNINQRKDVFPNDIKEQVTSLYSETGKLLKRRYFIQDFLTHFERLYDDFLDQGIASFKKDWEKDAFKLGETLTYVVNQEKKEGTFVGLNQDGGLVMLKDGHFDILYSAEIHWFNDKI